MLVVLRQCLLLGQLVAQVLGLPLYLLGESVTKGVLGLAFKLLSIALSPFAFRSWLEQMS